MEEDPTDAVHRYERKKLAHSDAGYACCRNGSVPYPPLKSPGISVPPLGKGGNLPSDEVFRNKKGIGNKSYAFCDLCSFIEFPKTQKIALEREKANQGKALTSPKA